MTELPEVHSAPHIPFLTFAIVGAAIGALRAKDSNVGHAAIKGAAAGVIAEIGVGILAAGSIAGYLAYKYHNLDHATKIEFNKKVVAGKLDSKTLKAAIV